MDLLSFNLKPFKSLYYSMVGVNTLLAIAAFVAGANVVGIVLLPENALAETRYLLVLLTVAAIAQIRYLKKLLRGLDGLTDFDEKVTHYMKIYKLRLYWKCASCLVSCSIHLLTGRNIFLYFALFDVLTTWTYFPNKLLIRKELKNDSIEFVED